ncbi:hypothetical protein LVJ82_02775 [Vitreoscilla massiliensis]|uniref:DUF4230 domain-containing protein n=1 Tax=Vitreoscilla massiliensis TaxID=1689272 RepID=A0ABY4E3R3_9NEIS|nr:hypothetical protein [Vitreoscilla massiliensis]UOO89929.1 hypothetical protein LVJ82_02775 [Vitreoscilla massiliensis]
MKPWYEKAVATPKSIFISIAICVTVMMIIGYVAQVMMRYWDIAEAKLEIVDTMTSGGVYLHKIDFKMVYEPKNDSDFVCGYVSQLHANNRISYRRFIYPKISKKVQFEMETIGDNQGVFDKAWKVICMEDKYELYFPKVEQQYVLINKLDAEIKDINAQYSSSLLDPRYYHSRMNDLSQRRQALVQIVNEHQLVTQLYPGINY